MKKLLLTFVTLCSILSSQTAQAAYAGIIPKPADGIVPTPPPSTTDIPPVTGSTNMPTPKLTPLLVVRNTTVVQREPIRVEWRTTNNFAFFDTIVLVPKAGGIGVDQFPVANLKSGTGVLVTDFVADYEVQYILSNGERLTGVTNPTVRVRPTLENPELIRNFPNSRDAILLVGDSHVEGIDATAGNGFAEQLSVQTRAQVVKVGRLGMTTRDLKALLPELLTNMVGLVCVVVGANDEKSLLSLDPDDRISRAETLDNLREIFTRFQERGAMVAFIGIVDVIPDISEGYRRVTGERGAHYIPNVRFKYWWDPRFVSFDLFHPNNDGYREMAARITPDVRMLLRPLEISRSPFGRTVTLTWRSDPRKKYRIFSTIDLRLPLTNWVEVVMLQTSSETHQSATLPVTATADFFRVVEEDGP